MKSINQKYSEISQKNMNTIDNSSTHKYIILPGNNSSLIRRVMQQRAQWEETGSSNTLFSLKWSPISKLLKGRDMGNGNQPYLQLVNHLPCHWQITTKNNLFSNLRQLAEAHKFNVFDFYPTTFLVNSSSTYAL